MKPANVNRNAMAPPIWKRAVRVPVLVLLCATASAASPPLPIRSGHHAFLMRDAEFPNQAGKPLVATIRGHHIRLVNEHAGGVTPKGVVAEGTLTWHAATKQWIIVTSPADRDAMEVGGCSGGPDVVDLRKRIVWTC